jgi:hypothetical protein
MSGRLLMRLPPVQETYLPDHRITRHEECEARKFWLPNEGI